MLATFPDEEPCSHAVCSLSHFWTIAGASPAYHIWRDHEVCFVGLIGLVQSLLPMIQTVAYVSVLRCLRLHAGQVMPHLQGAGNLSTRGDILKRAPKRMLSPDCYNTRSAPAFGRQSFSDEDFGFFDLPDDGDFALRQGGLAPVPN